MAGAPQRDFDPQLVPVCARGLTKRYSEVLAVDRLDLTVPPGAVFGFLGPNGAGKTTTLRMLLGLIMPSAGSALLFGRDPIREGARALAGVAGFVEAPRFYPYLSGRRNLEMMAALDGNTSARARIDELLELVALSGAAKQRVGGYSHGMGQRLGIAAALLREPRLLILDEPTTGLDPGGIRDMRELILRLSAEGITILLSSHQLSEVQEICREVAIIRRGRIVYTGAIAQLHGGPDRAYRLQTSDNARAAELIGAQGAAQLLESEDGELRISATQAQVGELSLALGSAGIALYLLAPLQATLEDLFFSLTEDDDDARPALSIGGAGADQGRVGL
ncbi:MAG TPA: ABC transporter ATP-binding protein [Solirubrobacteraceae bacterium]|nr:ABC transporter ATP-binding protein [Solirubrobacteraceae bacterium]